MASTTATRTRGPYAKTVRVQQEILDAAQAVFSENGYWATTVKDIAARAGISERGLVHHFAGKPELLSAVLERRETENVSRVPQGTDGLSALLGMLEVVAEDSKLPNLVELHSILSAEASATDHPAHAHYAYRYDMVRLFAAQAFAALRTAGELRSDLSDEELGASFIALSDGLQLQWLYDRSALDPTVILRNFLASVVPRLQDERGPAADLS